MSQQSLDAVKAFPSQDCNALPSNCGIDFGFDAEVAAGDATTGVGASPPIAVPTNKANAARMNLRVQVPFEAPEFRTVSPVVDQSNVEMSTDSPIGGGLMCVRRPAALCLIFRSLRKFFAVA
jgi:hypothetical protein